MPPRLKMGTLASEAAQDASCALHGVKHDAHDAHSDAPSELNAKDLENACGPESIAESVKAALATTTPEGARTWVQHYALQRPEAKSTKGKSTTLGTDTDFFRLGEGLFKSENGSKHGSHVKGLPALIRAAIELAQQGAHKDARFADVGVRLQNAVEASRLIREALGNKQAKHIERYWLLLDSDLKKDGENGLRWQERTTALFQLLQPMSRGGLDSNGDLVAVMAEVVAAELTRRQQEYRRQHAMATEENVIEFAEDFLQEFIDDASGRVHIDAATQQMTLNMNRFSRFRKYLEDLCLRIHARLETNVDVRYAPLPSQDAPPGLDSVEIGASIAWKIRDAKVYRKESMAVLHNRQPSSRSCMGRAVEAMAASGAADSCEVEADDDGHDSGYESGPGYGGACMELPCIGGGGHGGAYLIKGECGDSTAVDSQKAVADAIAVYLGAPLEVQVRTQEERIIAVLEQATEVEDSPDEDPDIIQMREALTTAANLVKLKEDPAFSTLPRHLLRQAHAGFDSLDNAREKLRHSLMWLCRCFHDEQGGVYCFRCFGMHTEDNPLLVCANFCEDDKARPPRNRTCCAAQHFNCQNRLQSPSEDDADWLCDFCAPSSESIAHSSARRGNAADDYPDGEWLQRDDGEEDEEDDDYVPSDDEEDEEEDEEEDDEAEDEDDEIGTARKRRRMRDAM